MNRERIVRALDAQIAELDSQASELRRVRNGLAKPEIRETAQVKKAMAKASEEALQRMRDLASEGDWPEWRHVAMEAMSIQARIAKQALALILKHNK